MSNLLQETMEDIKKSGHKISDIYFIGSEDGLYECTWDQFLSLANFEYDDGFGGQEVASDLIIVFKDGQTMTRGEYDGSEWWQYSKPFKKQKTTKPFKKQKTTKPIKRLENSKEDVGWYSIQKIND